MALDPDPKRKNKKQRPPGRPLDASNETFALGGEMLKSGQYVRNGGVYFMPIDEIVTRKGFSTYQEMRHDDQVKLCLEFKKILVGGRTWELKPADESEKAKEIAEFVEFNLRRVNLRQIIKEMLTAFEFGWSLSEILWEVGDFKGQSAILLKNLKPRDPASIEIKLDPHGNVLGFRQNDYGRDTTLPPEKVWHYAYNPRFGNPYGESDLRAAYRSWWAKKFVINFWSVFLERMGSPMTLMKYPQGAGDDLKNALKAILSGLSSKAEVLVPEGVEVELIEATRGGNANYEGALMFHNNSIARALLMVAILGAGGDDVRNAADSQSQIHLRATFKIADETTQNLSHTLHTQVIKQLVDMNFVHDNLYPTLIWQDYGQFEGVKVADTIRLLHAAGIIDMDQNDVNYARSVLGLPLRGEEDEEDEVVRPQPLPPPANANVVPPKAGQGNDRAQKGGGTSSASEEDDETVAKFTDLYREIEVLKAREPNTVTVNPIINVQQPNITVAAAPTPDVHVTVPPAPAVNVSVSAPENTINVPTPVVNVGETVVNVPKRGVVEKTFSYDEKGQIIKAVETEQ